MSCAVSNDSEEIVSVQETPPMLTLQEEFLKLLELCTGEKPNLISRFDWDRLNYFVQMLFDTTVEGCHGSEVYAPHAWL